MFRGQGQRAQSRAGRLVWGVVATGVITGAVTIGAFGLSLWQWSKGRAALETARSAAAALDRTIESCNADARADFEALGAGRTQLSSDAWLDRLRRAGREACAAFDDPQMTAALDELNTHVDAMDAFRYEYEEWAATRLHAQKELMWGRRYAEAAAEFLREAIDRAEGEQRLTHIRAVRGLQEAGAGEATQETVRVLHESENLRRVTSLKNDSCEVELLVALLASTRDADGLPNLKDNRFRPALERLHQDCEGLGEAGRKLVAGIAKLETCVFGEGCCFDDAEQSICLGTDGLYNATRAALHLEVRGQRLADRANRFAGELRARGGAIVDRSLSLAAAVAEGSRAIVTRTWWFSVAVSTLAAIAFLTLGARAAADVRSLLTAAQGADAAKSDFLSNMSHELRTPLGAIIGFADLLMDSGCTPEDRTSAVQTIRRNSEHLLAIINDVLDLARIEAGKLKIELGDVNVASLVEDVCAMMQVRAATKGLTLTAGIDPSLPDAIRTDPVRLRQILVNLVGNAVKFTEKGAITVHARYTPGERPKVILDVVDSGIGIERAELDKLFQRFAQADNSSTRRFGGTGLGLTISRSLAKALGGDICAKSVSGTGSTFSVTIDALPAQAPPASLARRSSAPSPGPTPSAGLKGRRILLAEDGIDNQRLIQFHLGRAGAAVTTVENGELAVLAVSIATTSGRPFDIILMDMQMPRLDGYGASTRLRAAGCTTPILALTAHAMSGDRERCLDAGCSDYLSKPVDYALLLRACTRWVDARTDAPCVPDAPSGCRD